jgi:tetratricopeptide (TPR) repeat protein
VSVAIAVISDLVRSLRLGTQNDRALIALLRGRLLSGRDTLEGATASIGYFDQAIRIDPDFAAAYAYKALSYRTLANWYAMGTAEAVARMRQLVNQALMRDPDLPVALLVSAAIKLYDGAYDAAERDLQKALSGTAQRTLSPKPLAAILLAHCGRFDEALALLDHGIESNPVHPRYLEHYKAQFLWYARRHHEALEVLNQVLHINALDKRAHELRGHVLISLNRYEEGVAELAWQFPQQQGWMRDAYATAGVRGIGLGYLAHAERIERGEVPFTPPASAWRMYVRGHAMLGEPAEAIAWMEQGWSNGDRWEFFYNRVYPWPGFDELRSHPDFDDLMSRTIGHPPTCPGYRAATSAG